MGRLTTARESLSAWRPDKLGWIHLNRERDTTADLLQHNAAASDGIYLGSVKTPVPFSDLNEIVLVLIVLLVLIWHSFLI